MAWIFFLPAVVCVCLNAGTILCVFFICVFRGGLMCRLSGASWKSRGLSTMSWRGSLISAPCLKGNSCRSSSAGSVFSHSPLAGNSEFECTKCCRPVGSAQKRQSRCIQFHSCSCRLCISSIYLFVHKHASWWRHIYSVRLSYNSCHPRCHFVTINCIVLNICMLLKN